MLKWLFGGEKKKEAGPQLCMPLLRSTKGLTSERIAAAWRELFPEQPALKVSQDENDATDPTKAGVMGFACGGVDVFVALMPAKIPTGEVEEAAKVSWMWKGERDKDLSSYSAHAIVMTMGGGGSGDATASAQLVSRVAACVVQAGECVGVYWGNGGMVHTPELFKEMAVDMMRGGDLAPPLWVNVLLSADGPGGPYSLSTTGMESFGHDEFEIVDSRGKPGELRMRLFDLASYVLTKGPVLKDGHTFGASETERIKVRVGRSKLGKPGRVIRLEMA